MGKEKIMSIKDRLKSPVVIAQIISILATLAVFFVPGYSEAIKAVVLALTSIINVVAGLNNPTDPNAF